MAQRSVASLGGGTVIGEAPRRRRAAQPGSDLGAVARPSRQAPRLASVVVDGADVPGVARGEGTLNSSMILAENGFPLSGSCSAGTRGPQIAEGHHVVRPGF